MQKYEDIYKYQAVDGIEKDKVQETKVIDIHTQQMFRKTIGRVVSEVVKEIKKTACDERQELSKGLRGTKESKLLSEKRCCKGFRNEVTLPTINNNQLQRLEMKWLFLCIVGINQSLFNTCSDISKP